MRPPHSFLPPTEKMALDTARKNIADILQKYSITSVFDAGCGDGSYLRPLSNIRYIGGDINAATPYDITKDPIPEVDLVFCRDLLGHLHLNEVLQALELIRTSKAKYFLTTTFMNRTRKQIGNRGWKKEWQPICFFAPPFRFPTPLEIINERCTEMYPNYVDKSLALWLVKDIPEYIPRKLFQTWHTKELPPLLQAAGERIRAENPDFEHNVFDYAQCDQFIQEFFGDRVVNAYRRIIPNAYKADMWRFCVLYIHGGIYMDISFELIDGFRLTDMIHKEHFSSEVRLHPYGNTEPHKGVSIGYMVVKPKNPILLGCINKIVEHVETEFYGMGPYDITSAVLLGSFFTEQQRIHTEVRRVVDSNLNGYSYNGKGILRRIKEYDKGLPGRSCQSYLNHWFDRTVYAK